MLLLPIALCFIPSLLAFALDTENLPETGLDTSSWVTGTLPPLYQMVSANDFQMAAKNVMDAYGYANYRTGSLDESTYNSNLAIWKSVRLNGFTFNDVSHMDMNTTILGYNFAQPFFIAPAAFAGYANNETAELSLSQAAGKAGILYAPSITSTRTLEEIAAVKFENQTLFHQEYVWTNKSRNVDELKRMEDLGYKAIFLTMDNTGVGGIRTRNERVAPNFDAGGWAAMDLASLEEFRNLTTLPIVPKGIKTWQDARKCLDLGFPAIYISNHGGRTLDTAPTSVEVLLDIHRYAPEVFQKMEVYADGGVRRGTDVIKLLALGARAVGLGRAPMFANVYGQPGVERLINLLATEVRASLALMGVTKPSELGRQHVNTRWVETMFLQSDEISY